MNTPTDDRSEPFQEPFQGWNDSAIRSMERKVERCDTETGCNPHESSRSTGTQTRNDPPYRSINRSFPSLRKGTVERGSVSEPKKDPRQDPLKVWSALHDAITTACTVRGDDAANVAGLLREAADLGLAHQRDLTAHFTEQARIWSQATGTPTVFAEAPERSVSPPVSPLAERAVSSNAPHFATHAERTGGSK
jgi:hypothetical protein